MSKGSYFEDALGVRIMTTMESQAFLKCYPTKYVNTTLGFLC